MSTDQYNVDLLVLMDYIDHLNAYAQVTYHIKPEHRTFVKTFAPMYDNIAHHVNTRYKHVSIHVPNVMNIPKDLKNKPTKDINLAIKNIGKLLKMVMPKNMLQASMLVMICHKFKQLLETHDRVDLYSSDVDLYQVYIVKFIKNEPLNGFRNAANMELIHAMFKNVLQQLEKKSVSLKIDEVDKNINELIKSNKAFASVVQHIINFYDRVTMITYEYELFSQPFFTNLDMMVNEEMLLLNEIKTYLCLLVLVNKTLVNSIECSYMTFQIYLDCMENILKLNVLDRNVPPSLGKIHDKYQLLQNRMNELFKTFLINDMVMKDKNTRGFIDFEDKNFYDFGVHTFFIDALPAEIIDVKDGKSVFYTPMSKVTDLVSEITANVNIQNVQSRVHDIALQYQANKDMFPTMTSIVNECIDKLQKKKLIDKEQIIDIFQTLTRQGGAKFSKRRGKKHQHTGGHETTWADCSPTGASTRKTSLPSGKQRLLHR